MFGAFEGHTCLRRTAKLSLDYLGRRGSCSRKGLEALHHKELSLETDVTQQSTLTKIQGPNKSNMIIAANGLKGIRSRKPCQYFVPKRAYLCVSPRSEIPLD